MRLMRIGFDRIVGYVEGGFAAVLNSKKCIVNSSNLLNSSTFVEIANSPTNFIVDIRNKSETESGKCCHATNIPLNEIKSRLHELPSDKTIYIHC